ncbi:hypothetical protein PAPYR_10717 [Paratrimastix pyriformis]|uniref:Uncharacterized protein n=1 Tax=Paratrimastix pyriformis TaxID=342808 RepID=A0ABQ8UA96_9EUKA|nr:hypothetical protein PAPYR_10717 [Paratrimastix pyriformis]
MKRPRLVGQFGDIPRGCKVTINISWSSRENTLRFRTEGLKVNKRNQYKNHKTVGRIFARKCDRRSSPRLAEARRKDGGTSRDPSRD